jgi:hexulose-6-phosphate isomerase
MSLGDTLALCRDAGYEAVELVFAQGKDLHVDMDDDELAGVGEQCAAADVEIGSVITQPKERGNLLSPDAEEREICAQNLRRSVEIAGVLGVDGVLLHPGQLGVSASYQEVWNNLRDELLALAPFAAERGVAIGVENVWNKFLLSPLEARLFVDEVASDWVGIYLDTANMMAYGYPEQWIRELGSRIKKVHFKDFKRREHQFVNLLDGDTDWPAVMRELRAIGYDSTLIHEVGGEREVLVDLGARMRRIVAM